MTFIIVMAYELFNIFNLLLVTVMLALEAFKAFIIYHKYTHDTITVLLRTLRKGHKLMLLINFPMVD